MLNPFSLSPSITYPPTYVFSHTLLTVSSHYHMQIPCKKVFKRQALEPDFLGISLASLFTSCMTLDKVCSLSVPSSSSAKGDTNRIFIMKLFER